MDTEKLIQTGIGTKETPRINPAKVKIVSVRFQTEKKDGTIMKTPLVHFECKHPDKEELISISKVKCERNGKLEVVGLWVQLDEDESFRKGSAVSTILNFLKCSNLEETYGKEVDLVVQSESNSYLCLKAY